MGACATHCGAVGKGCAQKGRAGRGQGGDAPLAPTSGPPSSSWSRSATSWDAETPAGAAQRYFCRSSCRTRLGLKPIRRTARTAGHRLHAAHSGLPPASARQGKGHWTKGREGCGGAQGHRREAASLLLWPVPGAFAAMTSTSSTSQGGLFPEPLF